MSNPPVRGTSTAVLRELRDLVGRPQQSEIVKSAPFPGLSKSTVSNLIRGRHNAREDSVQLYIAACLAVARKRRMLLPEEQNSVQYWMNRYAAAVGDGSGGGPTPDAMGVAWSRLVENHEAWQRVATDSAGLFRDHAVAIARRLFQLHQEAEPVLIANDPWHDPDLADRMSDRMAGLISSLEGLTLSAAEAALLALVPVAYQADATQRAALMIGVRPADLGTSTQPSEDRADYQRFLRPEPYRRLVSRACEPAMPDRSQAPEGIGWWLYHQWLNSRPRSQAGSAIRRLVNEQAMTVYPARELLVETLDRLLQVIPVDPEQLSALDRLGLDAEPDDIALTVRPHVVREQLIGLLVKLAHSLAIELTALPAVVVEHLGIPEPVNLADLRNTVRKATWNRARTGLVLKASCHHEAVWVALREHAAYLDTAVSWVHVVADGNETLRPLRALRGLRVSADKVVAAQDSAGRPVFATPVNRFSLDQERVRELLMGRQLYRDPGLAIRELYQNALDACRYRQARLRCRANQEGTDLHWPGEIAFVQGVDKGRHFLECTDNGVGMDETVLRGAFSQVGVRFVDRLEYLAEQEQFCRHGVDFVPNSRFGIGVMSYFMLADEIEVETCRMEYGGQPAGPTLTVTIAGPGHLFRIKHKDTGDRKPGTRVRLYLRDGDNAPSCVDQLRKLLGIAEFKTTATHNGQHKQWEPGILNTRLRAAFERDGIDAAGGLVSCTARDDGQVIWCEHGGALLVDGIYVRAAHRLGALADPSQDGDLRGAVVNLTGSTPLQLSVDRTLVLDDVSQRVETLLKDAVHELVEIAPPFLRIEWIHNVAESSPWVADLVTEAVTTAGTPLPLGNNKTLDPTMTGCFPSDVEFLTPDRDDAHDWVHRGRQTRRQRYEKPLPDLSTDRFPDHIAMWRWLAHHPEDANDMLADVLPGLPLMDVLPALPSDSELLANNPSWSEEDALGSEAPPPPGHLLWVAAATGTSPRAAAERAVLLGLHDVRPEMFSLARSLDSTELALLSINLDGKNPWLTTDVPVDIDHLLDCRRSLRLTILESADRLRRYGFEVPYAEMLSAYLKTNDVRLLSHDLSGESDWIRHDRPVDLAHLIKASLGLGHDVADAAAHLEQLGFRVTIPQNLPEQLTTDDLQLISINCDGNGPWLDRDKPVSPIHLIRAAQAIARSPRDIAERLVAVGFTVFALDRLPNQINEIDREIHRRNGVGTDNYELGVTKPVQPAQLFWITTTVPGSNSRDVAERLTAYGFEVGKDVIDISEQLAPADLGLLSVDHDGEPPWLDIKEPVPAAHLTRASMLAGDRPHDVARRLAACGFDVDPPSMAGQLTPQDRWLLQIGRWTDDWLDIRKPVPLSHLITSARRTGLPLQAAAHRLRELGFDVPNMTDMIQHALARTPQR